MVSLVDLVIFWLIFDLPYLAFRFTQYMVPLKTRDMRYNPLVTVLVPAYNEEKVIFKTLLSCVKQTYSKLEIVVIDDGSRDGTSRVVSEFKNRYSGHMKKRGIIFKHIRQKNGGKAAAMNTGLKNSSGEFVLSIDADSYPHSHAVKRVLRYFTDEKVGAVAGHIVGVPRKRLLNYLQYVEYEYGILFIRVSQSSTADVIVTPGAFSIYRRKALQRFEDGTVTEDFDTSVRIIEKGYKIVGAPDAICYTQLPANSADLIKQRVRWFQGGMQVFAKHFDHSKRATAHLEMLLLFLFGFYGTMIRMVSLILIPLMFYWGTGSAILALLAFMVYSEVIMFIQFLPVYRMNKDLKMFVSIPLFILYNFSILLYSCLVGQIRMFRNRVGWEKLRRYSHDGEVVSTSVKEKKREGVPYLDEFMLYSLKAVSIFVILYLALTYLEIYNIMLVMIASIFIAFTFRPLYMVSFISAYLLFYYISVVIGLIGQSEFILLFVYLVNMMWNTFIVVLYIKANYDLEELESPEGVTAPRDIPVTYVKGAPVGGFATAAQRFSIYTTSTYEQGPVAQGRTTPALDPVVVAQDQPPCATEISSDVGEHLLPVALPLTSISLPQQKQHQ